MQFFNMELTFMFVMFYNCFYVFLLPKGGKSYVGALWLIKAEDIASFPLLQNSLEKKAKQEKMQKNPSFMGARKQTYPNTKNWEEDVLNIVKYAWKQVRTGGARTFLFRYQGG